MSYKSLQQLRDEQKACHNRAMCLLQEAAEIQIRMKSTSSIIEFIELQQQWIDKDAEARKEVTKSIELINQFIQALERLKNRHLN